MNRSTEALSTTEVGRPTADEVRARSRVRCIGMAEAKRELQREHLLMAVQMFDLHGDRKLLTSILFAIINERRP